MTRPLVSPTLPGLMWQGFVGAGGFVQARAMVVWMTALWWLLPDQECCADLGGEE